MIEADALAAGFDRSRPSLVNVEFRLDAGQSLSVRGPSGSGKSTLLLVLAGLLAPTSGRVCLDGRDLFSLTERARSRFRRDRIGFVFQFGEMLPELNTIDNVALPLLLRGVDSRQARREALAMLSRFGIADYAPRDSRSLSGGELQRAAIARALVHRPSVVLADEPTGALDAENSHLVLTELLDGCAERGAVLVVATHDPIVAAATEIVADLIGGVLTVRAPVHST